LTPEIKLFPLRHIRHHRHDHPGAMTQMTEMTIQKDFLRLTPEIFSSVDPLTPQNLSDIFTKDLQIRRRYGF